MDVTKNDYSGLRLPSMAAARGVVPSLNGLRALSIILVFLSHTISDRIFPGGLGVRVFFLISGFLITRLMFVEWRLKGDISLKNFYIRRFLRLYPVVVIFTTVIVLFYLVVGSPDLNWQEPASALIYVANYYYSYLSQIGDIGGDMPFSIFWSLSVEEHFYLIFPLVFVGLKAEPRRLGWACAGVLLGCLGLRFGIALARPQLLKSYAFYYETQYQLDAIGFGVLMAALCELEAGRAFLRRLLGPVPIAVALLLLIVAFGVRHALFRETIRYSLLSTTILIVTANILFSARWTSVQRLLNTTVMDWIGRLSYSIYVWHYAAMSMVDGGRGGWRDFPIVLASTLVLASVSYHGIEKPLSGLRHRFGSVAPQNALT